jgi:hypothetical protein
VLKGGSKKELTIKKSILNARKNYIYGFQNQEKDDELKGAGNSMNFEFRMLDTRVGRFFAIDPLIKKYVYYSSYSFSGNRVLDSREIEGLEPENIHYYNMIKQEDGKYKPEISYSNSVLIIKSTNAKFDNTLTKESKKLSKGNYGERNQTTNVYTYWNGDGTIKSQVIQSKENVSQKHHYLFSETKKKLNEKENNDGLGTEVPIDYLKSTPGSESSENDQFVIWRESGTEDGKLISFTYDNYPQMLNGIEVSDEKSFCCNGGKTLFGYDQAWSDYAWTAFEGELQNAQNKATSGGLDDGMPSNAPKLTWNQFRKVNTGKYTKSNYGSSAKARQAKSIDYKKIYKPK